MKTFKNYIKESNLEGGILRGDTWLNRFYIEELPEFFKDLTVYGDFRVHNNSIKSLKNFPHRVIGTIDIEFNKLKSLVGLPIKMEGDIIAGDNMLENLDGLPLYMGDKVNTCAIDLTNNEITTLEGLSPKLKLRGLFLGNNKLKNLKGIPDKLSGSLDITNNPIESIEYFPSQIGGALYMSKSMMSIYSKEIRKRCHIHGGVFED